MCKEKRKTGPCAQGSPPEQLRCGRIDLGPWLFDRPQLEVLSVFEVKSKKCPDVLKRRQKLSKTDHFLYF